MNITSYRFSTWLFILLLAVSIPASATETEVVKGSAMLTPVIITLEIPDEKKNNPDLIASLQVKILEQLQDFQIDNITRYRYVPQLALSIDQAGLSALKQLNEVKLIRGDGLSSPQLKSQNIDTDNPVSPCHETKSNK